MWLASATNACKLQNRPRVMTRANGWREQTNRYDAMSKHRNDSAHHCDDTRQSSPKPIEPHQTFGPRLESQRDAIERRTEISAIKGKTQAQLFTRPTLFLRQLNLPQPTPLQTLSASLASLLRRRFPIRWQIHRYPPSPQDAPCM